MAECRWAIEKFHEPAEAFRLNNKQAEVYEMDCNDLLKKIMKPQVEIIAVFVDNSIFIVVSYFFILGCTDERRSKITSQR